MLRNFEVIDELAKKHGVVVKSSQELNKILENLGVIKNIGGDWWQTDFGMKFSPYVSKTARANEWLEDIVGFIASKMK